MATCHCGLDRYDYSVTECRFTPAMRQAQRLERMAPELLAALEALFADDPTDPSHIGARRNALKVLKEARGLGVTGLSTRTRGGR